METWDAFATIAGGAAAALTGLLFVAVSIRADYIARSQDLRNRAAQTLILFGTVLVIGVLLAIPGQGYRTLGAELLALAVITGAGLYVLDRRAKASRSNQAIAQVLDAVTQRGHVGPAARRRDHPGSGPERRAVRAGCAGAHGSGRRCCQCLAVSDQGH